MFLDCYYLIDAILNLFTAFIGQHFLSEDDEFAGTVLSAFPRLLCDDISFSIWRDLVPWHISRLLQEISGEAARIVVTPEFGLGRVLSWLIDQACQDDRVLRPVLDLVSQLSEKGAIFWAFLFDCGYMKLLTADISETDEQSSLARTIKNMTEYKDEAIWGRIAEGPVIAFLTQIISGDSPFCAKKDCFIAISNVISKGSVDGVRFVLCSFGDVLKLLPDFLTMEDVRFCRGMTSMLRRVIELCVKENTEKGTRFLEALRSESAVAAVTELVEAHGKEIASAQILLEFLNGEQ
jgi:hypothetical protein